jgi:hypothetical protein
MRESNAVEIVVVGSGKESVGKLFKHLAFIEVLRA